MRKQAFRDTFVAAVAVVLLTACGGGGGDGGGGSGGGGGGTKSYTLSGRIAVTENAAVDSDLNDPNQTNYAINNSPDVAQPLTAPVLLAGTVNLKDEGKPGKNLANGDPDDVYRVDLVAGQVVELEFASDPTVADVDLYVTSTDGSHSGASIGTDTRFECVQITVAGTYYVDVNAFSSASIYNLRIGAPGTSASCAAQATSARFVPNQLLAKPKPQAAAELARTASMLDAAGIRTSPAALGLGPQVLSLPGSAAQRSAGLATLGAIARGKSLAAQTATAATRPHGGSEWIDTLHYAKQLRSTGAYAYVEPNWLMERHTLVGTYPPNDRGYPYQRWHYEQIELPAAMARIDGLVTQPAQRPIAAIIDDGVVLDHPDLSLQLVGPGRSFISTNTAGDGNSASGNNPSTPADEPIFHGTHVAGTVGAATFDGIGGAGVAPMAQIMPLRVFAPGRGAATVDIVNAMYYAARLSNNSGLLPARRADVINMSLGSNNACGQAFQDAVTAVRAAGVMVVVSAGNSGHNDVGQRVAVGSPANCNGAIAVSATEAHKQITRYSNTGSGVVVAAPGGDTSQSTTGTGAPDGIYSDLATFDAAGTRQPSFGPLQGTSMAAPHVTGVMALMRYVNPGLTVAQVDALITSGAITDDLGPLGKDDDYGYGLINARKAVDAALAATATPPPVTAGQVLASPSSIDFGSIQTSASLDLVASNANTTEVVTSVTSDNAAVTVVATANVDPVSKLGRYTITVNRNALPAGTTYPKLSVALNTRTFTVQLSVIKNGVAGKGTYGPIYVLLIDPDTQNVIDTVLAVPTSGGYTWTKTGFSGSKVAVIAGGDLDNDGLICARGEPCGAYPVLPAGDLTAIDLSGDRTDLNFQVAPLSGISVKGAAEGRAPVWRRSVPAAAKPAKVLFAP